MKIPQRIIKNGIKFIFLKEYKNFVLYENEKTGCKESVHKQELGLIKSTPKQREARKGGQVCI